MSQKNTNRIRINPVICAKCGKLFLCKGRINLVLGRKPLPFSGNNCLKITYCECEDCHPPNKKDRVCANVSFTFMLNPSRRKPELNFLEIFELVHDKASWYMTKRRRKRRSKGFD